MSIEPDDANEGATVKDAAASTRLRPHEAQDGRAHAGESDWHGDPFFGGAKSIRLRGPSRSSLARAILLPVVLAAVLASAIGLLVLRSHVSSLMLADLEREAANTAYSIGMLGRYIIMQQHNFLAANPEYTESAEWRTGDHWLVAGGIIRQRDWIDATGFDLNELAPIDVLDRAAERMILNSLDPWLDTQNDTEMIGVYLLDETGSAIASSAKGGAHFNPPAPGATAPPFVEIGDYRVQVEHLADAEPEPLVRGVARIMSRTSSGRLLGSVVVLFRTQRQSQSQYSFFLLALALSAVATALILAAGLHAARKISVPLRKLAADMLKMAGGDYTTRSDLTSPEEIGLLAQAFNSMAERLRVARLNEKENIRIEGDLLTAQKIQNNLLPQQTPRVRGLDIHTAYRPAKEIGGDYFDFLPVDSQHMGIVVADASGKSIPAALVMSTTRAMLRFVAPGTSSATETLSRVNAILSVDVPKGMFVTAYYLILDPTTHTMLCASAGHTPLLIAREDGSIELVNPGGIALGFDGGPIFQRSIREQRVKMQQGDRILLYTDGVVECVNTANEEYSDRRLREFLRRNRDMSSEDFVGALLADLDRHRGAADIRDDTTIVTFRVL